MRKKEFVIFVFMVLCVWAMVTYFLFLYRPLNSFKDSREEELEQRLNKLEATLVEEAAMHKTLMSQLKSIFSNKKNTAESGLVGNGMGEVKHEVNREAEDTYDAPAPPEHAVDNGNQHQGEDHQVVEAPVQGPVIAILVFSCNRVTINRCIDGLLKYRPSKQQFPIIVTQDCVHEATAEVIRSYGDQISFIQQPDQSDIPVPPKEKKFKGYFRIARHYGWALNQTFNGFNYDTVIVVEDDLEIASDFYEYFLGTHELLLKDSTLWCVSAWNDNGKESLIDTNHPEYLYRTDFFPGLGWMLRKDVWTELSTKWPKAYWDDWIRDPSQRKGRACIRPEVSRTRTFGKVGVSNGLFFEKHLKFIKLNELPIAFTGMDLNYLRKEEYDVDFVKKVYNSPIVSYDELKNGKITHEGPVRIQYHTKDSFKRTAKMLGLMDDFRSGVPRTAYRGIVTFVYERRRVFLAPNAKWTGYNISWS